MAEQYFTNFKPTAGSTGFNGAMKNFGIADVVDLNVYKFTESKKDETAYQVIARVEKETPIATITSLKMLKLTGEGPTTEVKGGRHGKTLYKAGKTYSVSMEDALGNAEAIDALSNGFYEKKTALAEGEFTGLHFDTSFKGEVTLIGTTSIINSKTGQEQEVKVIIYSFLPNSVGEIAFDSSGEVAVFNYDGTANPYTVTVGDNLGGKIKQDLFYSIVDPAEVAAVSEAA